MRGLAPTHVVPLGDLCLARVRAVQLARLLEELFAGCLVDRAVDALPAEQRLVRGVDDHVRLGLVGRVNPTLSTVMSPGVSTLPRPPTPPDSNTRGKALLADGRELQRINDSLGHGVQRTKDVMGGTGRQQLMY